RDEPHQRNDIGAHRRVLTAGISLDRPDLRGGLRDRLWVEDQSIGSHGDQQDGGDVTEPGYKEERPGRQPQVEGLHVGAVGTHDLVEEGVGLHGDDEQQHERGKDVDHALIARADIGPHEVDRNVGAAIGRGSDTPEDEDAEQKLAKVVAVGNADAEVAQHNGDEYVGRNDADENGGRQLDTIDEGVHAAAFG